MDKFTHRKHTNDRNYRNKLKENHKSYQFTNKDNDRKIMATGVGGMRGLKINNLQEL